MRSDGTRFEVALRPWTTDSTVLSETFIGRYHLPPIPSGDVRLVLDLGANIGLTMAHIAVLCPRARIVGVELDPQNAELARRNTRRWSERCEVREAAVWYVDEPVRYDARRGAECGARLLSAGERTAQGISLSTLIEQLEWDRVDFVKMDIEGAERDVLRRNTGWATCVKSIKVEAHAPYSREECASDLQRLGFSTEFDTRHPHAVSGIRRQ